MRLLAVVLGGGLCPVRVAERDQQLSELIALLLRISHEGHHLERARRPAAEEAQRRGVALTAVTFSPRPDLVMNVARQACASDARGTEAVITRSGRSAFRKAQNSHLRSVRAEFLDKLSEKQLRQLAEVWTAVGLAEAPDTDYGT